MYAGYSRIGRITPIGKLLNVDKRRREGVRSEPEQDGEGGQAAQEHAGDHRQDRQHQAAQDGDHRGIQEGGGGQAAADHHQD